MGTREQLDRWLDQRWVVDLAGDRSPYICQSQSVNVFLPANVHKKVLHDIHFRAWKMGVKSLYYCRSKSLQRADVVATKAEVHNYEHSNGVPVKEHNPGQPLPLAASAESNDNDYEECLACQ